MRRSGRDAGTASVDRERPGDRGPTSPGEIPGGAGPRLGPLLRPGTLGGAASRGQVAGPSRRSRGAPVGAREPVLSHLRRTVVRVRATTDLRPTQGHFTVVSDFEPSGDQPAAIKELAEQVNAGEQDVVLLGRHRYRQVGDDGVADRAGAAADAGHRAEQDARRAAGQRVPGTAAEQRRRVLRLLLRLLPARGVRPADRHLHREGLVGQRRGRAAAALGHAEPAHPARRRGRRHRLLHLRPGDAAGVRRARAEDQAGGVARPRRPAAHPGHRAVHPQRPLVHPRHLPGARATRSRSSRCTRSSPSGSRCSATRSSGSTTCTRSPARSCARSRSCSSSRRRHYVAGPERMERAIRGIEAELEQRLAELEKQGKLLEAQRLRMRTTYDIEMMRQVGFCSGIENYSRHIDGRAPGSRGQLPHRLLPGRLPAGHRRVARDRAADRRHVRGRHEPQADARRARLPAAVGDGQPPAEVGGVHRPHQADGLPVGHAGEVRARPQRR